MNLNVKSEISLKLSLHKAFLLPIKNLHFKDLELHQKLNTFYRGIRF